MLVNTEKNSNRPENKTARLAQYRRWHKWGGVTAGLFLLVTALTGAVLNYKQPIFARLGIETKRGERDASPLPVSKSAARVTFTTAAGVAGAQVDLPAALALARNEWGEVALDRLEIRAERGAVSYRLRNGDGEELWINAADGSHVTKGTYERVGKPDKDGNVSRTTDWGKILIDVHTGKIGGSFGKALMTIVAGVLLLLTLSGFYLWLKPLWNRLVSQKR